MPVTRTGHVQRLIPRDRRGSPRFEWLACRRCVCAWTLGQSYFTLGRRDVTSPYRRPDEGNPRLRTVTQTRGTHVRRPRPFSAIRRHLDRRESVRTASDRCRSKNPVAVWPGDDSCVPLLTRSVGQRVCWRLIFYSKDHIKTLRAIDIRGGRVGC